VISGELIQDKTFPQTSRAPQPEKPLNAIFSRDETPIAAVAKPPEQDNLFGTAFRFSSDDAPPGLSAAGLFR
jgi:hypothetical protein